MLCLLCALGAPENDAYFYRMWEVTYSFCKNPSIYVERELVWTSYKFIYFPTANVKLKLCKWKIRIGPIRTDLSLRLDQPYVFVMHWFFSKATAKEGSLVMITWLLYASITMTTWCFRHSIENCFHTFNMLTLVECSISGCGAKLQKEEAEWGNGAGNWNLSSQGKAWCSSQR